MKGIIMKLEIGKSYIIKTEFTTYVNYKAWDFVNKKLKIKSIDGEYELSREDIISIEKIPFIKSLITIPKRIVNLNGEK